MDETYDEEEIFFGPISVKESGKIEKLENRKTRYLGQARIPDEANIDGEIGGATSDHDLISDVRANNNIEEIDEKINKDSQSEENLTKKDDFQDFDTEEEERVNINVDMDQINDKYDVVKVHNSNNSDSSSKNLDNYQNGLMHDTNNSSMCELGYETSDLNERNFSVETAVQNCSNSTTSENTDYVELRPNVESVKKKILQEETDQVSNMTFHLENTLALKKKLSISEGNDLNKMSKRESYFTSLEFINVDHEACSEDSLNGSINSDILNLSDGNIEVIESSIGSSDLITESKTYSSLDDSSSCNNPNNGLLLSHSLSSASGLQANKSEDDLVKNQLVSNLPIIEDDQLAYIPVEKNSPDSHSSCPSIPERRFNDTIEEMELLLARGIDYYKDMGAQEEDEEESIVQQLKEQTISSSNSVNSFNPNFDSTHASSGDIYKEKEREEDRARSFDLSEESVRLSQATETKKVPPEKPPRIMITDVSPKPSLKQLPINSCKNQALEESSGKANVLVHSPIVKTITKSKIENTPKYTSTKSSHENMVMSSRRVSPITTPKSTCNKYGLTPSLSKQLFRRVSPSTPSSCNRYLATSKSKIPRLTPPKSNVVFCTPQNVLPSKFKSGGSKSMQPKHRTLNIVSPVMKYLQDNPPPPLIMTVKPRYKLSPSSMAKAHVGEKSKIDSSSVKREQMIQKITDDVKNIAHKMTAKSPLKETNIMVEKSTPNSKSGPSSSVLPPSVYMKGESIKLNKENVCNRRTVTCDRPPVYILKHTGRMKLPKNAVAENEIVDNSSFERFKSGVSEQNGTPGRVSLMEVSVYEQHSVRRANTLK